MHGAIWQWQKSGGNDRQMGEVSELQYARSNDPETFLNDVPSNGPLPFDLGYCSPLRTMELLQAINILPPGADGLQSYREDRDPSKPWNDAWGNPIVLVYALYIPVRTAGSNYKPEPARDYFLDHGLKAYGSSRALYQSASSLGPSHDLDLSSPWDEEVDHDMLRDMWNFIRDKGQAHTWTESSFASSDWDRVRMVRGDSAGDDENWRVFMSRPIEIH